MPALNPAFIEVPRDTGARAWLRVDEISAILENTTTLPDRTKGVPCLTVTTRNSPPMNIMLDFPTLKDMIQSAGGNPMLVVSLETLRK